MSNRSKKIPEFATATSISNTDLLIIEQFGVNTSTTKKVTANTLATYIAAQVGAVSGTKGEKGDPGAAGTAGTKGDKGDTGTTGLTGAKGDPGAAGTAGTKGDKGDVGTTGLTGAKGDAGPAGGDADLGSFIFSGNQLEVESGTDIYVATFETGGGGESRLVLKPRDDDDGNNPTRVEGSYGVGIWTNNTDSDNTHKWLFGANGSLTLPANSDILDSTGSSVLGGSLTIITPEDYEVPGVSTLAFAGAGVSVDRIDEITTVTIAGGDTSYTPEDTDHWNEPTVSTVAAALDELAARLTAIQNYEIDGGNAYTPAQAEFLIDGNNGA